MKKILAVVLSLAMILSMSVCAFAVEPSATNTQREWTDYFTEVYTSDVLDAEGKANAIALGFTMTENVNMLVNALVLAQDNAEAQGVDTSEVNVILTDILAENGFDIEQALGEDFNGDGYLGDAAQGVVYVPKDATDVDAWTLYYTILLGEATTNPAAVIEVVPAIAADVISGAVAMDTFTTAFPAAAAVVGGDVVNQIVWGVEELLNMDLNSDNYIGKPDGSMEDVTLPEEDEGEGEDEGSEDSGAGFLDTVLGIIGSILDMIVGGGDSGSDEPTTDPGVEDEDPLWGEEEDPWGEGEDSTIPSTGDTTVIAVAAVALAAGAALVMTRKKSDDAE